MSPSSMHAGSSSEAAVRDLAQELRARGAIGVELAFVLGSGLGAFAERLEYAVTIPFDELTAMPRSRVPGHAGRFVVGVLAKRRVIVQQGRVHLYEGQSPAQVTRAVRACAALGCRALVLTNAAGGLVPSWPPGTLMRITDHLNLQGRTALSGHERGTGTPWDTALGAALALAAQDAGVPLERGVYAAVLGPSYETPAEIRMLRRLGADAVGMSTVLEACAAHAAGLAVAGVSLITNPAAGLSPKKLEHADVVAAGERAAAEFCALLEAAVPRLLPGA
jgi:purine-nucleoside phosphorylase